MKRVLPPHFERTDVVRSSNAPRSLLGEQDTVAAVYVQVMSYYRVTGASASAAASLLRPECFRTPGLPAIFSVGRWTPLQLIYLPCGPQTHSAKVWWRRNHVYHGS